MIQRASDSNTLMREQVTCERLMVRTNVLATETIPAFAVVTSTGKVADSANGAHFGRIVGVAKDAIQNGFRALVIKQGELVNTLWNWTIGDVIFLNGTSLSTTPPATGFNVVIGTASRADTISVDIQDPTLL